MRLRYILPLGGYRIAVFDDDELEDLACFEHQQMRIRINCKDRHERKELLVHECLHAIDHIYGLELCDDEADCSPAIKTMAAALHQMLAAFIHEPRQGPEPLGDDETTATGPTSNEDLML